MHSLLHIWSLRWPARILHLLIALMVFGLFSFGLWMVDVAPRSERLSYFDHTRLSGSYAARLPRVSAGDSVVQIDRLERVFTGNNKDASRSRRRPMSEDAPN